MFSDYLVIIQTTKDTFINVNVCEKSIPKAMVNSRKVLSLPKNERTGHIVPINSLDTEVPLTDPAVSLRYAKVHITQ